MKNTSTRVKEVSALQKTCFILSIAAIPLGLCGIAGGIIFILMLPGDIAAACGSIIIFLGLCLATIPLVISLVVLNLRLKCQGNSLVIVKSYLDITRPGSHSFRGLDDANNGNGRTVITNPYVAKETSPNYSKLLHNYHEVGNKDSQHVANDTNTTDKVQEQNRVSRNGLQDSETQIETRPKRIAPPAPLTDEEPRKSNSESKPTKLGKPVPVPVVPTSFYNRAFDESKDASQVKTSAKADGFQMTVSIETAYHKIRRDASHEIQNSPQNNASLSRSTLPQNELVLPPRNASSLYPPASPSYPTKYEEIGTRM